MPTNCKMPELKAAFAAAGFESPETVLGSGNVVFGASRVASMAALEKKCEAAMTAHLGRPFTTFARSIDELRELLDEDPFKKVTMPPGAKTGVTFLHEPPKKLKLPIAIDGAALLWVRGAEVGSYHTPNHPSGPIFMRLIEEKLGKDVTTRTWLTVMKVVAK
jgi:uncharacterized protein (DUF1697 family)